MNAKFYTCTKNPVPVTKILVTQMTYAIFKTLQTLNC